MNLPCNPRIVLVTYQDFPAPTLSCPRSDRTHLHGPQFCQVGFGGPATFSILHLRYSCKLPPIHAESTQTPVTGCQRPCPSVGSEWLGLRKCWPTSWSAERASRRRCRVG